MDETLHIPEIQNTIFSHFDPGDFVGPAALALKSLAALARTCKSFQRPALEALWRLQTDLVPALQLFPDDVWDVGSYLGKKTFLKFRRPLVPIDWERPLVYWKLIKAFRIFEFDKERISPDVWETLRNSCPTPSLFPNVREASWFVESASFLPLFSILLSPRLKSVSLLPGGSSAFLSILSTLGEYSDLTHVDLRGQWDGPAPDVLESISAFILKLRRLESLRLPEANGAIIMHLARLPSLKSLVVDAAVRFSPAILRNSSDARFPSLRALHLWAISLDHSVAIVEAVTEPAITSLNLVFNAGTPDAQAITRMYTAIASNRDHSALRYLRLEDGRTSYIRAYSPDQRIVPTETLGILFAFTNLTTIILKPFHGLELDDETMLRIARTWRRVEELRLAGPARVTLAGIHSLARHCPDLRVLEIFLDASSVPVLDEIHPQTRLTILVPNESPISSPAAVSIFLSSVFPGLQDIEVILPVNHNRTRRLWNKVDHFLKAGTEFAHDDDENK
ncbi:hypothetical protein DFH08DRAFT_777220 [Mycena albidolilacea]|uniref:F-box domain-containing protein n=1 Tax=Mycena albidolilacea TaxID=1033008 RepID=A0AAD7A7X8_9AGAR|nr:hypothetical protein DFH08DRAFT_777220 [Mycena albidolilacea]